MQARGVAQGVQCPLLDARVPKSGLTLWKCCWLSSVNAPPPPQLLGRPHSLVSCRVACREVGARPTLAQDCTVWHCSAAVAAERRVELYQQLTDGGAHHTSSHPGPPLHLETTNDPPRKMICSLTHPFSAVGWLKRISTETDHLFIDGQRLTQWSTSLMLLLRSGVKCTLGECSMKDLTFPTSCNYI